MDMDGMRIRVSPGAVILGLGVALVSLWEFLRGEGLGASGLWGRVWPWLTVILAAGVHEAGHLLAALGAGVAVRGLRLDLFGARMELGGLSSYGQEAFVALGGPLANLVSVAAVYPVWRCGGCREGGLLLFWVASLVLCGVNLLPVASLDGGRVLFCALAKPLGEGAAEAVVGVTTAICLGGLWLLAAYSLLRSAQLLSLFVFSLCLLLRSLGRGQGGLGRGL